MAWCSYIGIGGQRERTTRRLTWGISFQTHHEEGSEDLGTVRPVTWIMITFWPLSALSVWVQPFWRRRAQHSGDAQVRE